ncbi:uncharacterized protein PITG_03380 [Phytophthora infestans T30-4]|uniref:NAD-dependent epimerase/dehydratase domain-containing protein n=1 Tax=Phytophthora infestans (strain T30-4) TaxID=403677 RepID=D0N038_PHYIT|nr:uncharacterized protein PITG_03380 [Phytophthora infestans T30-4]EEY65851.1 conserved hypothetical protein [Phytophthora infestans T30-4]|eukprot:XP_002906450.1 conserved hypothetical protein [Phytophthora infestans T30-4]
MSKKLLVIGGAGALGRGVVSHFTRASWRVTSVDFSVNTIVCTAGGWAGGSIRDADSLFNLGEMYSKNLESAFLGE